MLYKIGRISCMCLAIFYAVQAMASFHGEEVECKRLMPIGEKAGTVFIRALHFMQQKKEYDSWKLTAEYTAETSPSVLGVQVITNETPLVFAINKKNPDLFRFLIGVECMYGADDDGGQADRVRSAVYAATYTHFLPGVEFILKTKCFEKIMRGDQHVLEQLRTSCLQKRADFFEARQNCCAPGRGEFDSSYEKTSEDIAKLLVEYGADGRLVAQNMKGKSTCTGAGCAYLATLLSGKPAVLSPRRTSPMMTPSAPPLYRTPTTLDLSSSPESPFRTREGSPTAGTKINITVNPGSSTVDKTS